MPDALVTELGPETMLKLEKMCALLEENNEQNEKICDKLEKLIDCFTADGEVVPIKTFVADIKAEQIKSITVAGEELVFPAPVPATDPDAVKDAVNAALATKNLTALTTVTVVEESVLQVRTKTSAAMQKISPVEGEAVDFVEQAATKEAAPVREG